MSQLTVTGTMMPLPMYRDECEAAPLKRTPSVAPEIAPVVLMPTRTMWAPVVARELAETVAEVVVSGTSCGVVLANGHSTAPEPMTATRYEEPAVGDPPDQEIELALACSQVAPEAGWLTAGHAVYCDAEAVWVTPLYWTETDTEAFRGMEAFAE